MSRPPKVLSASLTASSFPGGERPLGEIGGRDRADNLFLRRVNALLGKLAGRIKALKPEESAARRSYIASLIAALFD
ncbi:MAG: hypothetical protein MUQ00_01430 [Candidatus Aminicenantes bacterium]|nr:hypothetical protein [Candidatus Aminicenantes bacterium]